MESKPFNSCKIIDAIWWNFPIAMLMASFMIIQVPQPENSVWALPCPPYCLAREDCSNLVCDQFSVIFAKRWETEIMTTIYHHISSGFVTKTWTRSLLWARDATWHSLTTILPRTLKCWPRFAETIFDAFHHLSQLAISKHPCPPTPQEEFLDFLPVKTQVSRAFVWGSTTCTSPKSSLQVARLRPHWVRIC